MKVFRWLLLMLIVGAMVIGSVNIVTGTDNEQLCSVSRTCSCSAAPAGWPCSTSCSRTGACECDSGCDPWDGAWCTCAITPDPTGI